MSLDQPPFTITNAILKLVADISEALGRLSAEVALEEKTEKNIRLRRVNRMRTIQGSLAIEGNTLSGEQITLILDGKRVIAPPKEVKEAHNAIAAYELLETWQFANEKDLLSAHKALMMGLVEEVGMYRRGGVGVMSGEHVVHMAPQADRVQKLMANLLSWLDATDAHPLIASSVFHYEFEFIHPFADGNGRLGRLWQTLILSHWHPVLINVPVESLVHQHQDAYYQAIRQSTSDTNSAAFIEFMLQMIMDAITETRNEAEDVALNIKVKLNEQDKAILALIAAEPFITMQDLARSLEKSVRTIERRIKYLKEANIISRIGAKKTGKWEINNT